MESFIRKHSPAVILTAAFLMLAAALLLVRENWTPRVAAGLDDPAETVSAFFESISAGDFEAAADRLAGTSSLGMTEPEAALDKTLFRELCASYSYELVGESRTNGVTAEQDVRFTALSVSALAEPLSVRATDISNEKSFNGEDYTSLEACEDTTLTALKQLLSEEDISDYYVTAERKVTLSLVDGEWKISLDDGLYDALTGRS